MRAEQQSAPAWQSSRTSLCTLQTPLLSGIPLAFLIWQFPCCFWDQGKHVLDVNLLQCSSCSTAYGFRIIRGHNSKGVQQLSKISFYCSGTCKVLMGAYLHGKAPKILSQSGPCFGHQLFHSSSWLMTVKKQDSNHVLNLQTAWLQYFLYCSKDFVLLKG